MQGHSGRGSESSPGLFIPSLSLPTTSAPLRLALLDARAVNASNKHQTHSCRCGEYWKLALCLDTNSSELDRAIWVLKKEFVLPAPCEACPGSGCALLSWPLLAGWPWACSGISLLSQAGLQNPPDRVCEGSTVSRAGSSWVQSLPGHVCHSRFESAFLRSWGDFWAGAELEPPPRVPWLGSGCSWAHLPVPSGVAAEGIERLEPGTNFHSRVWFCADTAGERHRAPLGEPRVRGSRDPALTARLHCLP